MAELLLRPDEELLVIGLLLDRLGGRATFTMGELLDVDLRTQIVTYEDRLTGDRVIEVRHPAGGSHA